MSDSGCLIRLLLGKSGVINGRFPFSVSQFLSHQDCFSSLTYAKKLPRIDSKLWNLSGRINSPPQRMKKWRSSMSSQPNLKAHISLLCICVQTIDWVFSGYAIAWKLWQTRQPYDEAYHLQQRLQRSKLFSREKPAQIEYLQGTRSHCNYISCQLQ